MRRLYLAILFLSALCTLPIYFGKTDGIYIPGVTQKQPCTINQMAYWSSPTIVDCGYALNAGAMMQSNPISGGVSTPNVFVYNFTATLGSITALLANTKTVSIPGLLTTDAVTVNCVDAFTLGANIANARVSAADTLELTITTAIVLGITLGSLHYRVIVVRA